MKTKAWLDRGIEAQVRRRRPLTSFTDGDFGGRRDRWLLWSIGVPFSAVGAVISAVTARRSPRLGQETASVGRLVGLASICVR